MTVTTNKDRAERAAAALRHFQCTTGTDYDDALADLRCDLHHWCDRENADFQSALDRARQHYAAERQRNKAAVWAVYQFEVTGSWGIRILRADSSLRSE